MIPFPGNQLQLPNRFNPFDLEHLKCCWADEGGGGGVKTEISCVTLLARDSASLNPLALILHAVL